MKGDTKISATMISLDPVNRQVGVRLARSIEGDGGICHRVGDETMIWFSAAVLGPAQPAVGQETMFGAVEVLAQAAAVDELKRREAANKDQREKDIAAAEERARKAQDEVARLRAAK